MVPIDNKLSSAETSPNSRRKCYARECRIIPNYVSLHKHLTLLTRFFLNYMPHPEDIKDVNWNKYRGQDFWNGASTPLFIAASIDRTDCHIGIVDNAALRCQPAYEYDSAAAKFTSRFVEEATRLIWSWISFETVTKKLCHELRGNRLTDKAIQYLISVQYSPLEGTGELVNLLREICPEKIVETALSVASKARTENYLHIHFFREIRNSLVHSGVHDIAPSDSTIENPDKASNDDRVLQLRVASRLILLTIQNLVIGYLFQSPLKTGDNEDDEEYDDLGIISGVEGWRAIESLHIKRKNSN